MASWREFLWPEEAADLLEPGLYYSITYVGYGEVLDGVGDGNRTRPTLELQQLSGGEWQQLVSLGSFWKYYWTADGLRHTEPDIQILGHPAGAFTTIKSG